MQALLISGLSRPHKAIEYLKGTLFDRDVAEGALASSSGEVDASFTLYDLGYSRNGAWTPLLRPYSDNVPHLTTATVASILDRHDVSHVVVPLERLWEPEWAAAAGSPDVVLLSTTFICNRPTLSFAIAQIREHFPGAALVLGGQYSNLKYRRILLEHPTVDYILRGDGEEALPALLDALGGRRSLDEVPNLVTRRGDEIVVSTRTSTIDLDAYPSPTVRGEWPIMPYESMRGCPFTCRFCSYPAASPEWRYKSAQKIVGDWARYRDDNGVRHVKAMDSTFTVPHTRMRDFLALMPGQRLSWEAYARANVITDAQVVEAYERAGCRELSIGFESMSDRSLKNMDKRVTAKHNRDAARLLADSSIRLRVCIMVGYPGESVADYSETHDFLVHDFAARCMLSPFSFIDETMPVWDDLQRFGVTFINPDDTVYGWKHDGMDIASARELLTTTLDELRWKNDRGVMLLWQMDYQTPLAPHLTDAENRRVEKLVERLAFVPKEFSGDSAAQVTRRCLDELQQLGIDIAPPALHAPAQATPSSIWIDFI